MMPGPLFALLRSSMPAAVAEDPCILALNASDLGVPPGPWPEQIATDLGNGSPFALMAGRQMQGLYLQRGGSLFLRVFRD